MASKPVEKIVFGTSELGRRMDDAETRTVLESLLERGYKELDSALMYSDGESEKVFGRLPGSLREKFIVSTKANPFSPKGLRPESVLEQLNTSLQSIQASSVDIFYLHMPDHDTPIEQTLGACQQLYTEGKFKELGLSNYASWEVVEIYYLCKQHGWVLPTVYQGMYNAITRDIEKELIPALRHLGMRFYAYNPLAGGLLTGKYKFEAAQAPDSQEVSRFFHLGGHWASAYRQRYWKETNFNTVALLQDALKNAYGSNADGSPAVSTTAAAFRWVKHHSVLRGDFGDGIIFGASSLKQATQNLDACEGGPLDQGVVDVFDQGWQANKADCPSYFR